MKKIIAILMALTLLATACVLAGCNNHTDIQDDKLSVVTTIFPEYDWVKNILGDKADRAELTMLLDNGVDLHSYQPTVDDISSRPTAPMPPGMCSSMTTVMNPVRRSIFTFISAMTASMR